MNVQLLINVVCRVGLAARTTDALPRLLGRSAGTLESYIADHLDCWTARRDREA